MEVRDLLTYAAGPLVVALVVAVIAVTGEARTPERAVDQSRPTYDAETGIRAAIPAVEAYNADNGTYAGLTVAKLRAYDSSVQPIVIVRASKHDYCIENPVGPGAHKNGPAAGIEPGLCPR